MNIVITHCRYIPKWDSLQTIIREATNEPDGKLIQISRRDKGCNYRELGIYDLKFRFGGERKDLISRITLNVKGMGEKV